MDLPTFRYHPDPVGTGSIELPASPAQPVVSTGRPRTPGFTGWQQERWFTHCGDAAAFLGEADRDDLKGKWSGAVPAIRAEMAFSDEDWADVLERFAKGPTGSPTAYVFECLHCGQLGGYWDSH